MKNIAILGAGNIANRVAKGIQYSKNGYLMAVASRDVNKAEEFAKKYNIEKYYGSYEQLCKDSEIDIIYICTPNHLHYQQIKMCFDYHKHVICEKPMVRNEKEVEEIFEYAKEKNCFLMEAHKTCFTPLNQLLFQKLQSKEYGDILSIEADYSYDYRTVYTEDSWVMNENNGGCSYDVGVYAAVLCNYYANSQIQKIVGTPIRKEGFVADFGMRTQILYENGIVAQANCNWLYFTENKGKALILTTKGMIEIPCFWKSNRAIVTMNDHVEQIVVDMDSDFTGEIEEAVRCIEKNQLESITMSKSASKNVMKIIDVVNEYR